MGQKEDNTATEAIAQSEKKDGYILPINLRFDVFSRDEWYLVTVYCGLAPNFSKGKRKKDSPTTLDGPLMGFSFTREKLASLRFYNRELDEFFTVETASTFSIPNMVRVARNEELALAEQIRRDLRKGLQTAFVGRNIGTVSSVEYYDKAVEILNTSPYKRLLRQRAFYVAFIKMVNKPMQW